MTKNVKFEFIFLEMKMKLEISANDKIGHKVFS